MDYVQIIVNSTSNISIKMIQAEDIMDFNKWWPNLYKKNTLSIESFGKAIPRD